MSEGRLTAKWLRRQDVRDLAGRLRDGDVQDCLAHEHTPEEALLGGWQGGPSWGVWDGDCLIGAGGWTFDGAIWTLWSDLTRSQSLALMRVTPSWARKIAEHANEHIKWYQPERRLQNAVWEDNRLTIAWLRATRCVDFLDTRLQFGDKWFIPFFLKPLAELPNV